ncbi:hypothetical protein J4449_04775 [Candidatus Woesearchaeota archaeon]|nr:hypothetical protein [Candidatus Woesearchaeota archaeon]
MNKFKNKHFSFLVNLENEKKLGSYKMADIKALCSICGKNWADLVCDNCLSYVCQECFDKDKKMCKPCTKGPQF